MSERPVVLVTGASGALGAPLLRELRGRGWRTRALVHRQPVEHADERVRGDLGDGGSLRRAAEGADAVLHLAAVTHARDPRTYEEGNVRGTEALVDACRRMAVRRFVLVSTRAVSESGGAYSRSKLRAEEIVRASGLPSVVVRLPEVYGAGGGEGVDGILLRAARGRPIPLVGRGLDEICPVLLADVLPAGRLLARTHRRPRPHLYARRSLPVHPGVRGGVRRGPRLPQSPGGPACPGRSGAVETRASAAAADLPRPARAPAGAQAACLARGARRSRVLAATGPRGAARPEAGGDAANLPAAVSS